MRPYTNEFIFRSRSDQLTIVGPKNERLKFKITNKGLYFHIDSQSNIYIICKNELRVVNPYFQTKTKRYRFNETPENIIFCGKSHKFYIKNALQYKHTIAYLSPYGKIYKQKELNIPNNQQVYSIFDDYYSIATENNKGRTDILTFKNIDTDEIVFKTEYNGFPVHIGCGFLLVRIGSDYFIVSHKGIVHAVNIMDFDLFLQLNVTLSIDEKKYTFWAFANEELHYYN